MARRILNINNVDPRTAQNQKQKEKARESGYIMLKWPLNKNAKTHKGSKSKSKSSWFSARGPMCIVNFFSEYSQEYKHHYNEGMIAWSALDGAR